MLNEVDIFVLFWFFEDASLENSVSLRLFSIKLCSLKEGTETLVLLFRQTHIRSINEAKQTVTIGVEMFGRETAVEISVLDIRKFED